MSNIKLYEIKQYSCNRKVDIYNKKYYCEINKFISKKEKSIYGIKIYNAVDIKLLDILREKNIFVNTPCNGKGICSKCKAIISFDKINFHEVYICKTTINRDCILILDIDNSDMEILECGSTSLVGSNNFRDGYGVVIDIGTTTLAAGLINMSDGIEVCTTSKKNPQIEFGQDILTRIQFEVEQFDYASNIFQVKLVNAISDMIDDLIENANLETKIYVKKEDINEIVISGNCTMIHTIFGEDIRSLGRYPYKPSVDKFDTVNAKSVGIQIENCVLHPIPFVSAYIGGDIVSGIYSLGKVETENYLFIDIGTNGELVFYDKGRYVSCSCAVGPSLEGMNISCGMRAETGAIENIKIDENLNIEMKIIGGKSVSGICGSGVISIISELLSKKIIKKNGTIVNPEEANDTRLKKIIKKIDGKYIISISEDYNIYLTQSDIRQVQLAKAAIYSGIESILDVLKKSFSEVEIIYIAGQFGKHIKENDMLSIGLLPKEFSGKIRYIGNSSKSGAYKYLMNKNSFYEVLDISEKIEYIDLSKSKDYEKRFIKSTLFR